MNSMKYTNPRSTGLNMNAQFSLKDIVVPQLDSKYFPYDNNFIYHVTGSLGGYVVEVFHISKDRSRGSIVIGSITNMPTSTKELELLLTYED